MALKQGDEGVRKYPGGNLSLENLGLDNPGLERIPWFQSHRFLNPAGKSRGGNS